MPNSDESQETVEIPLEVIEDAIKRRYEYGTGVSMDEIESHPKWFEGFSLGLEEAADELEQWLQKYSD